MDLGLLVARAVLLTVAVAASLYYALAIYAAFDFFSRRRADGGPLPPISILKPIRGLDPDSYASFASFCAQEYPDYELIFGSIDDDDPGAEVARQIIRDYPGRDIRLVTGAPCLGANPKVSNLAHMAATAKHALLLVSDSDIRAGPGHLRAMAQPLTDPSVGVVTCLYRSDGRGWAGRLDALGLSTEFQPSVLVARAVEGIRFGLGAGILIRRTALEAVGGFPAIADYLADDYLLGALPARAGWGVALATEVVEHRLGPETFWELVRHQLRWNRGIRACRPGSYAGLVFLQATAAGLLGLVSLRGSAAGWALLALTWGTRLAAAWIIAGGYLRDRDARRLIWLVPVRDLLSTLLWGLAFFGRSVQWRGARYRVGKGGRLARAAGRRAAPRQDSGAPS